ncbi:glycoside hydrolase family 1 protein [Rossellomorea marisflavi]|uniref:glycoside hydrolase family 1 protein n=1 Tax=Rossellomorea marisflavi TaxID=189381 RepID=UPI003D2F3450
MEFPKGFMWGAASSAPQMEGASSRGGKSPSVWDHWFQKEPRVFYQGIGPEETTDFYANYKEDILLMKELGFNSYRTSISWTRLMPDGHTLNDEAVEFYRDVFTRMLDQGIRPVVNLFHFDMPYWLYEKGGWDIRESAEAFALYAETAFKCFGDLVEDWVTFNEPIVPVEMGYLNDKHLPGVFNIRRACQAAFHTLLAHVKAVQAFRKNEHRGRVGIVLNLTPSYPRSENVDDVKAAELADALFNKSFLDPVVKGEYPHVLCEFIRNESINVNMYPDDLKLIKDNPVDFLGVNYYQPRRVKAGDEEAEHVLDRSFLHYEWPDRKMNPHRGWEIYEKGIYDIAIQIRDEYGNIPWFIAENGMGVEGEDRFRNEAGFIQDEYRIEFFEEHLRWLHKGIREGSNCYGFHVWTYIDNWSWLNEYKNRYGLVEFDLDSGERRKKKSADWFRKLAESNRLPGEAACDETSIRH